MKYLKYIAYTLLIVFMGVACKVNSSHFPVDTGKLTDPAHTGGYLRVIDSKTKGSTWNILKLSSQKYVLTFDEYDIKKGGQLKSVDFYLGYQDGVDTLQDVPVSQDPFLTLQKDDFARNSDTGLLRATTTFTSKDLLDVLGLQESDIEVGSIFLLRWTLNLTNGLSFNADNSGQSIKGGAFYNSPFATNIVVSASSSP